MKHGVVACEDVLVDADGIKQDDVLRDSVRELIDADVVEDVDVLKKALSDVGVVEQVVPDVTMKH
eukprot:3992926-Amphidinium_carterae.1